MSGFLIELQELMEDQNNPGISSALTSLSEGAGLYFLGRISQNALGFITNLVLTRILGASLYGLYAYFMVISSLIMVFTRLGADRGVLRFIPEYSDKKGIQNEILMLSYTTSMAAGVIVAGIVYQFAPIISQYTLEDPLFVDVLRIGAIILPFNTLTNITMSVFRSVDLMEYKVVTWSFLNPLTRLVCVGGAVLLGASVLGAIAGLVASSAITLSIAVYVLLSRTGFGKVTIPRRDLAKEYYNFTFPLSLHQLSARLYGKMDILMIGFFLSGGKVGIYNVAVLISGFLMLPLSAFNQLFPAIAADQYHNDQKDKLQQNYSVVTRWVFTISLFPVLTVFIYSNEILQVFGEEFGAGSVVLIVLGIAQLANVVVGPAGYLLMMADNQYLTLLNQASTAVLNLILNYIFILQFGIVGAAIATAISFAFISCLSLFEIWYLDSFFPYDKKFVKPLIAGMLGITGMALCSIVLSGLILLIIGIFLGFVLYAVTLYLLGLEEEEVIIIREASPAYIIRILNHFEIY